MKYLSNIISLIGLCSLGYGLYLESPSTAFSVCGGILVAYGILVDIVSARAPRES